jgi:hypothetical protein
MKNKKKVTSVESGILGEKYIETEDGKHYKNEWGSREAQKRYKLSDLLFKMDIVKSIE